MLATIQLCDSVRAISYPAEGYGYIIAPSETLRGQAELLYGIVSAA